MIEFKIKVGKFQVTPRKAYEDKKFDAALAESSDKFIDDPMPQVQAPRYVFINGAAVQLQDGEDEQELIAQNTKQDADAS